MIRAGVLSESTRLVGVEGTPRPVRVVTLAPRGRRFVRGRLGIHLYNHNRRQAAHDLRLTAIYWELPQPVRETWRCEGELIAEWKAAGTYRRGVCVDAAVEVDGLPVAIEVAVGYSERDRALKAQAIARHFGGRGHLITEE